MMVTRRTSTVVALMAVGLVAAGCDGWSTAPTNTTTTSAVLHAQTRCVAETTDNPCTYWFQYWPDGATSVLQTQPVTANVNTHGYVDVQQAINGLQPNTLYHAQFCGFGDRNIAPPGLCIGLPGAPVSTPGNRPDTGDYNATQRFRTAGPGTRATADLGRPLSTADTAVNPISRDGGLSAAYSSTHSLWLFGDTAQRIGPRLRFLVGTTAAAGPHTRGQVPTALQELPTPPAPPQPGRTSPAPFLPAPQGLLTPDNPPVPCGTKGSSSYAASWPAGLARIPGTSRLLIMYAQVCVASGRKWPTERLSLVEYDPATNRFLSTVTPFVSAPLQEGIPVPQRLGSPVFGGDGYLYMFGAHADIWNVETNMVFAARVPANPAAWGSAENYQWWGRPSGGPAQWTSDQSSLVSIVPVSNPWSVHVADYTGVGNHRLAMVVQTSLGTGDFQLFEASSPTGTWTAGPAGKVPDTCLVGGFGCYAFSGHPHLSTADRFVFSWYSAGDRSEFGHVRLATITW